jgi:dynein heavy chain, axonemal
VPETVQRHINKCFEGIGQLEMNKGIVSGMVSMEKEKVAFSKRVDVNEGDKKGNVEKWLLEIEGVMIDTLKKVTKTAIEDGNARTDWVKMWPAQTVLGVNMIRWTNKAEAAISSSNVKDYVAELVN